MKLNDLDFSYPDDLVALNRVDQSRVMFVEHNQEPRELLGGVSDLLSLFNSGDVLVINNSAVLKRRLFTSSGLEILFLNSVSELEWEVLCPSSRWKAGTKQSAPDNVELEIVSRGRPQIIKSNKPLDESYFQKFGELPLPPYIQKVRGERHNRSEDQKDYQTAWAEAPGSLAAPTASLHFTRDDLHALKAKGVHVVTITLHVGLGTFLPITATDLKDHVMHAEQVEISAQAWEAIQAAKASGKRIWALGTTVTRSLESAAHGLLPLDPRSAGGYFGETRLFIQPGFEFRVVDVLCTNFHQPESTLLALVGAFAGLEQVKNAYAWAIERKFRLFSYGDLTVWTK